MTQDIDPQSYDHIWDTPDGAAVLALIAAGLAASSPGGAGEAKTTNNQAVDYGSSKQQSTSAPPGDLCSRVPGASFAVPGAVGHAAPGEGF